MFRYDSGSQKGVSLPTNFEVAGARIRGTVIHPVVLQRGGVFDMKVLPIRAALDAAHPLPSPREQTSVTDRTREIWPYFVVGFGLLATLGWMAFLGWALWRAARMLLA